ncbi:MAG: F0F1 ATP synthase subunit A [Clostridia bacterium]|jgi:F-type H+-transporting ATPase subunit a|nr:F0F1 ATP synthase subunit A [Clostridia bacterium]MDD4571431.1 F0F1 ATP synthase subunit A [Clostridia bacterium]
MEHGSGALFHIGPMPISSYTVTMLATTIILGLLAFFATRKIKKSPGKLQLLAEMTVGGLRGFFYDILGKEKGKTFLPLLGTLFIFILISNLAGLLPFAGHLPGLASPTSTLSVTVALSVIIFFVTHMAGFKYNKISYLRHFVTPVAFLLPLTIMEEFVRPLSLSVRLYGNVFGDESVIAQLANMVPYGLGVPVIMALLTVLLSLIQALVFTLLSAIYIDGATSHAE